jgi:hypothetical protein
MEPLDPLDPRTIPLKRLIQELGKAIAEAVEEGKVGAVAHEIRQEGFEVILMLEANIGLSETDEGIAPEAPPPARVVGEKILPGTFSLEDQTFFKGMRIERLEDSDEDI